MSAAIFPWDVGDPISAWRQVDVEVIVMQLVELGGQHEIRDPTDDEGTSKLIEEPPFIGGEPIRFIHLPITHDAVFPVAQDVVFHATVLSEGANIDGGAETMLADRRFIDVGIANRAAIVCAHMHHRAHLEFSEQLTHFMHCDGQLT